MNPSSNTSSFSTLSKWVKNSISLKLAMVAFLTLILMIPIGQVKSLIWERQSRESQAIAEVSNIWGKEQTIAGPIITIPYNTFIENTNPRTNLTEVVKTKRYAHFLPEELKINGEILPEIRYRGIYEAVVYKGDLTMEGYFMAPDFDLLNIKENDLIWSEAYIEMGISDVRSIKEEVIIDWGDMQQSFNPGLKVTEVSQSGIFAKVSQEQLGRSGEKSPFKIKLAINGSSSIAFLPVGKKTAVNLTSNWPDPSFSGSFLPNEKEVSPEGFNAQWEVLHLNRPFAQQFVGAIDHHNKLTFGVQLIVPVNEYQQSMRAVKYAVMLISLTFAMFFFAQIMKRIPIHPIQYLLVGLSICLFYTLLVAFSEHFGFAKSYIIAATATLSSIVMYIHGFIKNAKLTSLIGGLLGAVYAFIYVILQQKEASLLIGSIGLFVILTTVMYYTRKINWAELRMN